MNSSRSSLRTVDPRESTTKQDSDRCFMPPICVFGVCVGVVWEEKCECVGRVWERVCMWDKR